MINFRRILRDGTFLADYMDFFAERETALAYDFWSGLWLMGNAIGRRCYVDRPGARVWLNWYIILVAASGITRKSTSVDSTAPILHDLADEFQIEIIQGSGLTTEALQLRMQELTKKHGHSHVALSISELVTALGRNRSASGLVGLLTDLYDAPGIRRSPGSLKSGPVEYHNSYTSLLAASTPTWLARSISPEVVEGGFTSRCMFIYSDRRKKPIAWPKERKGGPYQDQLTDHLKRLAVAASRYKRFEIADGALSKFTGWYNKRRSSSHPYRASFESREDGHVLRLAACLSANDDRWVIHAEDIKHGITIIEDAKERGAAIFESAITTDRTIIAIDKLRSILIAAGLHGLSQRVITGRLSGLMKAGAIEVALDTLLELDMVQKFEHQGQAMRTTGIGAGKVIRGRPTTIWRATQKLAENFAVDDVLLKMPPVVTGSD